MLALSTVFDGTQYVVRNRRRPTGTSTAGRRARQVFGDDVRKELPIPAFIDAYNHNMNGVDIGDQMRSYYNNPRPVRRGGWQALAWDFLLNVIVVNTYILQRDGQPRWQPFRSQLKWRQELSAGLISTFGPSAMTRKRARSGLPSDRKNEAIPVEQHEWISRNPSPCVVCAKARKRARAAFGEIANNGQQQRKQSRKGCRQCNVALCTAGLCWDLFHHQN